MTRSSSHGAPTQRQLKVNELLRKTLSDIFLRAGIEDPELRDVSVTVTEVRVSPDLRNATVFVFPRGAADQDRAVRALQRHQRFLRGELARAVSLKFTPSLGFRLDESFARAERLDEILRSPRVARDLG
jgi:ribosome-binding factor A